MDFDFSSRLPMTPGNGPPGSSEGFPSFTSRRQSRRVETPDDASSVGSMASSRDQSRRCYRCRQVAILPSQPLVKCEVCKVRYHCSCHQPPILDYSKPFTCSRCMKHATQKSSPFDSRSRLSTTTPSNDAVSISKRYDSLNRGQQCSTPGCQVIVQTLNSSPDGSLLCKQHEIASKYKSASAQSSSHKPHIPSRPIQKDKLYVVHPDDRPLIKRQRSVTAKHGTQHDSNLETSNVEHVGSSRQTTTDELHCPVEQFAATAIRQQAAGSNRFREIRRSIIKENQNGTVASVPTVGSDGSPMSLSFITERHGSDHINAITPSATTPSRYVFHSPAAHSNGGSIRDHHQHENNDSRLPTVHKSWSTTNQVSSTKHPIDTGNVISNQFPVLPGLSADEASDFHGDLHKTSDQDSGGNVSHVDTHGNSAKQNSVFIEKPVRNQYMTPTALDINAYARLGRLESVADAGRHTSARENTSMVAGNRYDVEPDREKTIDPTASITPSLRPTVFTSLRHPEEEATKPPQAQHISCGAATNLKSRPAAGGKLESLPARSSPRSPRSFSADWSLHPESEEACPAQKVVDYDPSGLDAYLRAQTKPKSRRQPNAQELAETQIWAHIDPRKFWPPEPSASWFKEKDMEIAARGGKKANWGQVITAQNRKERSEKGWNIHQSRESKFGTPEDLERVRMLEELIGVEDIKDMVPAVVDGVLCVVDPPEEDEQSLPESQREGRTPRCFPV